MAELPKTVWEETVVWKGKAYTVTFERISLVADLDYLAGGRYADYHLTVKDEAENIIFQQTMINYPVTYEEVYWFTDLSGDGFPDIIFCTDHYIGRNSYMTLHFMIWNAEIGTYEPKPLPEPLSIPLWNDAHSSVIGFSQTEEKTTLMMFTCRNGEWELSGQLLPVYEEDEEGNLIYQCYKEVFYADGEVLSMHYETANMTEDKLLTLMIKAVKDCREKKPEEVEDILMGLAAFFGDYIVENLEECWWKGPRYVRHQERYDHPCKQKYGTEYRDMQPLQIVKEVWREQNMNTICSWYNGLFVERRKKRKALSLWDREKEDKIAGTDCFVCGQKRLYRRRLLHERRKGIFLSD